MITKPMEDLLDFILQNPKVTSAGFTYKKDNPDTGITTTILTVYTIDDCKACTYTAVEGYNSPEQAYNFFMKYWITLSETL